MKYEILSNGVDFIIRYKSFSFWETECDGFITFPRAFPTEEEAEWYAWVLWGSEAIRI